MTGPSYLDVDEAVDGAVHRNAERALCGTLLRRPERMDDIRWLQPPTFGHAPYRAIYGTMVGLAAAGELAAVPERGIDEIKRATLHNIRAIQEAWMTQRFTDVRYPSGQDPLHEVYSAVPFDDGHHVRYARIVVEEALLRELEPWADALFNVATSPAVMAGELEPLQLRADQMYANLYDLRTRLARSGDMPRLLAQPPSSTEWAPVQVPLQAVVPPHPTMARRSELEVLHAVLVDPEWQASGVLWRFAPADFAQDLAHANTWRAMQSLQQRGEPIDYVTVAYEVRGLAAAHGRGLTPNDLARAAATEPVDPRAAIDRLARASIFRRAAEARADIVQAANDFTLTPEQAADRAQEAAGRLGKQVQTITGAPAPVPKRDALTRRLAADPSGEQTVTGGRHHA